jgi:hypothetical protein
MAACAVAALLDQDGLRPVIAALERFGAEPSADASEQCLCLLWNITRLRKREPAG